MTSIWTKPIKALSKKVVEVEIKGHKLHCQICGHDGFARRRALLSTSIFAFFGFDWFKRTAVCYVCDNCGHMEWFLPK